MKKKFETLKDLYNFIMIGGNLESVDFTKFDGVTCACECLGNEVYEDENLYEFMRALKINEIDRTESEVILSDGDTTVSVDYVNEPNRFGNELDDETIYLFNTIKIIGELK